VEAGAVGRLIGRRAGAAVGAGALMTTLAAAPVSALLAWTLVAAPLAATLGQTTTFTLTATNLDRVPHDVVLIRTALPPDRLPTTGIRVEELDPAIEILARTPRLEPRATGSLTASLAPGTYVLVCSVPHHYVREAMVATITAPG